MDLSVGPAGSPDMPGHCVQTGGLVNRSVPVNVEMSTFTICLDRIILRIHSQIMNRYILFPVPVFRNSGRVDIVIKIRIVISEYRKNIRYIRGLLLRA